MCVIAIKPRGINAPDATTLKQMWEANPDGAGFMYVDNKHRVQIRKGFMKWKSFLNNYKTLQKQVDAKETPIIFHFRIETHGGVSPENTHPFPITDDVKTLRKTSVTTSLGVAHNGIISSVKPRKGLSDTMEYIATQLAPLRRALPKFYEDKNAMLLVKNAIGSKMAFLTGDGNVYTVGDFELTDDGLLCSNTYWQYRSWRSVNWTKYNYDWYEDEDDYKAPFASRFDDPTCIDLMDLTDGDYVRLPNGELAQDYDVFTDELSGLDVYIQYCIDRDGKVYAFDYETEECTHVADATAFNATGLPLRFDEDLATPRFLS